MNEPDLRRLAEQTLASLLTRRRERQLASGILSFLDSERARSAHYREALQQIAAYAEARPTDGYYRKVARDALQ